MELVELKSLDTSRGRPKLSLSWIKLFKIALFPDIKIYIFFVTVWWKIKESHKTKFIHLRLGGIIYSEWSENPNRVSRTWAWIYWLNTNTVQYDMSIDLECFLIIIYLKVGFFF